MTDNNCLTKRFHVLEVLRFIIFVTNRTYERKPPGIFELINTPHVWCYNTCIVKSTLTKNVLLITNMVAPIIKPSSKTDTKSSKWIWFQRSFLTSS